MASIYEGSQSGIEHVCAFERNLLELYDIQLYNKKLNLKAINLEWYIQQSNGMVLPTANEINHYKCKCPPVDSYRI